MQLLKMRREEKLDLIRLARYLERQAGKRHGQYYSKNAGCYRSAIGQECPTFYYLLHPEYKWFRDYVIFYSRGWGWRVHKDWRQIVKQIECFNEKIFVSKVA